MSRHIASLYTAAADALERGKFALATAFLRQASDDTIGSTISEPTWRLASHLTHPCAIVDRRIVSEIRSVANDFAEAARENDR